MIIAIIILSVLVILSIITIIVLWKVAQSFAEKIYSPTAYACKLLLTLRFNQPENSTITDFSKYESNNIVSVIENLARPPGDEREAIVDGVLLVKDYAVIYEIEGEYVWYLS